MSILHILVILAVKKKEKGKKRSIIQDVVNWY